MPPTSRARRAASLQAELATLFAAGIRCPDGIAPAGLQRAREVLFEQFLLLGEPRQWDTPCAMVCLPASVYSATFLGSVVDKPIPALQIDRGLTAHFPFWLQIAIVRADLVSRGPSAVAHALAALEPGSPTACKVVRAIIEMPEEPVAGQTFDDMHVVVELAKMTSFEWRAVYLLKQTFVLTTSHNPRRQALNTLLTLTDPVGVLAVKNRVGYDPRTHAVLSSPLALTLLKPSFVRHSVTTGELRVAYTIVTELLFTYNSVVGHYKPEKELYCTRLREVADLACGMINGHRRSHNVSHLHLLKILVNGSCMDTAEKANRLLKIFSRNVCDFFITSETPRMLPQAYISRKFVDLADADQSVRRAVVSTLVRCGAYVGFRPCIAMRFRAQRAVSDKARRDALYGLVIGGHIDATGQTPLGRFSRSSLFDPNVLAGVGSMLTGEEVTRFVRLRSTRVYAMGPGSSGADALAPPPRPLKRARLT